MRTNRESYSVEKGGGLQEDAGRGAKDPRCIPCEPEGYQRSNFKWYLGYSGIATLSYRVDRLLSICRRR